jgi:catechol 2,3-dioxygenase-like lactoylglutathione lyase family enzyme
MRHQSRIMARDLEAARRFYSATARWLGLSVMDVKEDGFALGHPSDAAHPVLQVKVACAELRAAAEEPETQPTHVAIAAPDDFTVRAFYRAAMEAGGRQLGYPGPQPTEGRYSYYATKVADPDGNCIECGWRH